MASDSLTVDKMVAERYRLVRRLGAGTSGVVFLARDTKKELDVAIKFLTSDIWHAPDSLKRFIRESAVAKSIDHPNVLPIYETSKSEGVHFHVMQYCEKGTLSDLIPEEGFDEAEALGYMLQTAVGLKALHDNNILHRDLKSSNVLVGKRDRLRISDFGLARWTSAELTQTRSLGTPSTLAPELWDGSEATVHSDIYALGVLFYQVITGRLPFNSDSMASLVHAHMFESPTPPSGFVQCSKEVEVLIGRMLAKRRYERPDSVEEVIQVLEDISGGRASFNTAAVAVFGKDAVRPVIPGSFLVASIILTVALGLFSRSIAPQSWMDSLDNRIQTFFDIDTQNSYAFITYIRKNAGGWDRQNSKDFFEAEVNEGTRILKHRRVTSSGEQLLFEIHSKGISGSWYADNMFKESGSEGLFNCPAELPSCTKVSGEGFLWAPYENNPTSTISMWPVAFWKLNKKPLKVQYNGGSTSVAETHTVGQFSQAWKLNFEEGSSELVDFYRWPKYVEPDIDLPSHFMSLLRGKTALVVRHYWGCRESPFIFSPRHYESCSRFQDHVFVKDQSGKSLGPLLSLVAVVEKAGKARIQRLSLAVGVGSSL